VARLDDFALEGFSAADQITDPLILLGGDVDEHEATVPEILGDADGIAAIGLAVLTGSRGHERGHTDSPTR